MRNPRSLCLILAGVTLVVSAVGSMVSDGVPDGLAIARAPSARDVDARTDGEAWETDSELNESGEDVAWPTGAAPCTGRGPLHGFGVGAYRGPDCDEATLVERPLFYGQIRGPPLSR